MSFKKILCHDSSVRFFQKIIAERRIAHAYIFAGPNGVGKKLFAKELTKTLLCESDGLDACDNCRACRRVESGNHPDLHYIAPEKEDKFIKIDYIHAFQDDALLKPVEAGLKVFVIDEADRMNEEASNCLLKTLEEPPSNTLIILIATSVKSLVKTIASRCQVVRFNPLPSSAIEAALTTRFNAKLEVLKWASQSSCGSFGRAVECLEKGFYERARYICERLSSLKLEDNFPLSKEIVEWDSYKDETSEEKRSRLRRTLDIFLQFYRDTLQEKVKVEVKNLLPLPFSSDSRLKTQDSNLTVRNIIDIIENIVTSIEHIESNVNPNLVLENLLTKIAIARCQV